MKIIIATVFLLSVVGTVLGLKQPARPVRAIVTVEDIPTVVVEGRRDSGGANVLSVVRTPRSNAEYAAQ